MQETLRKMYNKISKMYNEVVSFDMTDQEKLLADKLYLTMIAINEAIEEVK